MLARTCPSSHPQESSLMLSGILSRLYLHPSTGPRRYGRLLSTYVEWVCRSGMWRTVSVAHALSVCCTRCSQRTVTQHGTTNHAFDQPQLYPQARPRLGPVQRENLRDVRTGPQRSKAWAAFDRTRLRTFDQPINSLPVALCLDRTLLLYNLATGDPYSCKGPEKGGQHNALFAKVVRSKSRARCPGYSRNF